MENKQDDDSKSKKEAAGDEETATSSTSPPPKDVLHSDVCSICQENVSMLDTTTFRLYTCCGKVMHTKCMWWHPIMIHPPDRWNIHRNEEHLLVEVMSMM